MLTPPLGEAVPRRGNRLGRAVGRAALALGGWRFEGAVPNVPRAVIIVAPHTSNWDFVVGIAARLAIGFDVRFIGKDSLFRPPFGPLLRWLGGLPVDRAAPEGLAEEVARRMREADGFFLALSPEGTRHKVDRWKTGFHRIARGAGAPIWPVAFDHRRKVVVFMPPFAPTPDVGADVRALRALFSPEMARYPDQF